MGQHGNRNIPFFEQSVTGANRQSAAVAAFAPSKMAFLCGRENLVGFKMKPGSAAVRTYTRCCHTAMISATGAGNSTSGISVAINRNTVQPPLEADCRANSSECVDANALPKDGISNCVTYSWTVLAQISRTRILGTGGIGPHAQDKLISGSADEIKEIAGKTAYDRLGFKDVKGVEKPTAEASTWPTIESVQASMPAMPDMPRWGAMPNIRLVVEYPEGQ